MIGREKHVLSTSGFLLSKNDPPQDPEDAECPGSPWLRGMLLLCFRRKQSLPSLILCCTARAGMASAGTSNTLKWILETNCENFLWMV